MYIPRLNRATNSDDVWHFVSTNSFASLISQVDGRPWATHIPILAATRPDGTRYLHGHIARANPHWRHWRDADEVLVIFTGPHAYVSSSWYDHLNVPTWNYIAVHVYGRLRIIEGEALYASIKALTDKYEAGSEHPVSVEGLPPEFVQREMKAVVGFELEVTEVQAKEKLSQNRDAANHARVVTELEKRAHGFDVEVAAEMKKRRP